MAERLSEQVSDDLLARLSRGEFEPGDYLPSEQALGAYYGVGRNTVREAMHGLRTLGLVEIRPRLGAKVLDHRAESALASSAVSLLLRDQTVHDLYDVRLILEPAAAARAAENRTSADVDALRRAITHFRVAYETGGPVWEGDLEFHQAVVEASGNSVLPRLLSPVSDLLASSRQATGTIPAAVERALHEHEEIAAAIEAGSPRRARRAMKTHIESAIWALDQVSVPDPRLAHEREGA
jgi:GntR family transcriptional repressor for pyruvate dehydrogenase complex